jgi:hypothetical protein
MTSLNWHHTHSGLTKADESFDLKEVSTVLTTSQSGIIDYIFYWPRVRFDGFSFESLRLKILFHQGDLHLEKTVNLPVTKEARSMFGATLPAKNVSSDHFCIASSFVIEMVGEEDDLTKMAIDDDGDDNNGL